MKILFADENHEVLHETLSAAGHECDLLWHLSEEVLKQKLPSYDALVIRSRFKIDRQLIDACPRLKCIGRVGAGLENIDVNYARDKGIACVAAPEGNRDAVGEHAIGMLLMLLNNLKKADHEVRRGVWLRAENRGTEIQGKTVGIIGYGNTGSAFAKKLSGFGCRILAHDKYRVGFGDDAVAEATLEQLFESADILSLHIPLTHETTSLVNRDFISGFTKPFWFINTSRGPCVNTGDLVDAMKAGRVRGACLDVLEYERLSFEGIGSSEKATMPSAMQYLINSENVILTPHIAGWTHESNYKMSMLVAERLLAELRK
jgi:D-3-phosphoglycerate dehydrogenase / 2-oxoglutarate reductase